MAIGCSVELHHNRILCQSVSLLLGCKIWSSFGSRFPVHILLLESVPKVDTGFSVSEAVFGSPLTIPGEFLDSGNVPSPQFLQKIKQAVSRIAVPPPHQVSPSPPAPFRQLC